MLRCAAATPHRRAAPARSQDRNRRRLRLADVDRTAHVRPLDDDDWHTMPPGSGPRGPRCARWRSPTRAKLSAMRIGPYRIAARIGSGGVARCTPRRASVRAAFTKLVAIRRCARRSPTTQSCSGAHRGGEARRVAGPSQPRRGARSGCRRRPLLRVMEHVDGRSAARARGRPAATRARGLRRRRDRGGARVSARGDRRSTDIRARSCIATSRRASAGVAYGRGEARRLRHREVDGAREPHRCADRPRTYAYLSPEQIAGDSPTAKSDRSRSASCSSSC